MRISFRGAPGTSPLFLDYLDAWPLLHRYYSNYYSPESVADFARKRPRLEPAHLDRLCAALHSQHKEWGAGATGIDKLSSGAVAVVTGQQPGLFTGPMFALYKAITAIMLARTLSESGVPAVPVFWIAAEDHDHEEIRSAFVLNRDSQLHELQVDLVGEAAAPVGWTQYGEDIKAAINQCMEVLPQSEFSPEVRDILETSFRPGGSPVDAFGRMMSRLFAGAGMVFVNPLHPVLKELAKPALDSAVLANEAIRSAVLNRSEALIAAGYHAQVKVDQNFTGLFRYNGKFRQVLKPAELSSAGLLSPNALLRPVVQDSLFPTVAYVGGPAEIAYFAQSAAVYQTLGRPMPPVFPRISATLLEPRIKRGLQKYGLDFLDVLRGPDALRRKAVEGIQDVTAFDRVRTSVTSAMESLGPTLSAVDPTLMGALENSQQKMLHQVEGLRTKFVNAEARRNEVLERHLEAISNSLFPDKKLQERVINVTSFLVRFGPGLVGRVEKQLDIDPTEHQILEIE